MVCQGNSTKADLNIGAHRRPTVGGTAAADAAVFGRSAPETCFPPREIHPAQHYSFLALDMLTPKKTKNQNQTLPGALDGVAVHDLTIADRLPLRAAATLPPAAPPFTHAVAACSSCLPTEAVTRAPTNNRHAGMPLAATKGLSLPVYRMDSSKKNKDERGLSARAPGRPPRADRVETEPTRSYVVQTVVAPPTRGHLRRRKHEWVAAPR
eukprot:CAMPEP_0197575212 /NCGR_PEP_ID=MMETSP1326-20131121/682_1 /TAXON_ID=1155430 /ORGANISM="Genus nov. species nov., Strain RCC2288" /LENGTH=209 /DNA_ID=CAMNT_0043137941 /DNA_START=505 /DNA_END=1131 /DNA_ORIENTATION=+